jgi:hypothetical protein
MPKDKNPQLGGSPLKPSFKVFPKAEMGPINMEQETHNYK